jgi:hypothetical protein
VRKHICHIKHRPVPYITEMGIILVRPCILFSTYNTDLFPLKYNVDDDIDDNDYDNNNMHVTLITNTITNSSSADIPPSQPSVSISQLLIPL